MEGALVVAKKNGKHLDDAKVVFVETLAHNKFNRYQPGESQGSFAKLMLEGRHPLLYVEPKGHGIEAYSGDQKQISRKEFLRYMMRDLRLLNTRLALVIVYTAFNLPFVVWMMRGFFVELPRDLEEAALVDGDSRIGALWRVVLPLVAPGLAATAVFCLIVSCDSGLIGRCKLVVSF